MQTNILSQEIRVNIAKKRLAGKFLATIECMAGGMGATITALEADRGLYGLAVATGIPAAYLLLDSLSTLKSVFERPFNLTQTLASKLTGVKPFANWKTDNIEKMIAGEGDRYSKLESGIAQKGDAFYVDCRMPGVVEEAKVIEVDEKGFRYKFDWGGICSHFWGMDDGGILQKLSSKGKQEFYREAA